MGAGWVGGFEYEHAEKRRICAMTKISGTSQSHRRLQTHPSRRMGGGYRSHCRRVDGCERIALGGVGAQAQVEALRSGAGEGRQRTQGWLHAAGSHK